MSAISAVQKFDALKTDNATKQKGREPLGAKLGEFGEQLAAGAAAVVGSVAPVGMQLVQGVAGGVGGGPVGALVANTLGGVTGIGGTESGQQAALIQLQRQVNQENLYWQTCSNIEKANNDSKANTVRAIKP